MTTINKPHYYISIKYNNSTNPFITEIIDVNKYHINPNIFNENNKLFISRELNNIHKYYHLRYGVGEIQYMNTLLYDNKDLLIEDNKFLLDELSPLIRVGVNKYVSFFIDSFQRDNKSLYIRPVDIFYYLPNIIELDSFKRYTQDKIIELINMYLDDKNKLNQFLSIVW